MASNARPVVGDGVEGPAGTRAGQVESGGMSGSWYLSHDDTVVIASADDVTALAGFTCITGSFEVHATR